ncbi:MAG: RNA methyltransferase [Methylococcaceae bacterium]|nr:MAG: RNA methyltransferase [Methylococcaceae bacterium]
MVETSHPGNIGAAARAMMNMGLSDLCLVRPKDFPSAKATARASGACGILRAAKVCDDITQAIADCQIVVGASARDRSVAWPALSPRALAEKFRPQIETQRIAVVFGREHSGLSNDELDLCQYLLRIPCNPKFSSLNVGAAVQVVAYEFYQAAMAQHDATGTAPPASDGWPANLAPGDAVPAGAAEIESFFSHLQQALFDIGFFHATKSGPSLMRRLRRLFHKARLEQKEIHMLRGILSQMQIRLELQHRREAE